MSNEYTDYLSEVFNKAFKIAVNKSRIYGTGAIGELGLKGEFVQIHRKYSRLKQIIWLNNTLPEDKETQDSLEDTLLDMINYCGMMMYILKKEKNESKNS